MGFSDHVKQSIIRALEQTLAADARDAYVVSLFVDDEEDDPRYPTVTVGFNTEAQVADTTDDASDADEARWNFAFWLQNELAVVADREQDPVGAELREQWLRTAGLWYSDEEEAGDFDATTERADQITARFVELLVTITQELHAEDILTQRFGRPLPVLIHELEYYDEIAEQNLRANPDGLAERFARWIEADA